MAMNDNTAAAHALAEGLKLSVWVNLTALAPMPPHQPGGDAVPGRRPDEAVECFTTARTYARQLNQPPTEVYILDSLAKCHALGGKPAEAERCWAETLTAHDKISAPPLAHARDGGGKLIGMRLEQHHAKTRQADKLAAVRKESART